ncbi:hypothetical protein Chor_003730, partial [Crotalus horridus]
MILKPTSSSPDFVIYFRITEDSAVTTFEALKARVRELERQLSRGDRYKCLICMDSYTMPLTSIQCWHVHCEECWLRTL